MKNYPLLKIWADDAGESHIEGDLTQPKVGWNENGVQWLIRNYKTMTRREMSKELKKPISSVDGKLYELRRKGLIAGMPKKEKGRTVRSGRVCDISS